MKKIFGVKEFFDKNATLYFSATFISSCPMGL